MGAWGGIISRAGGASRRPQRDTARLVNAGMAKTKFSVVLKDYSSITKLPRSEATQARGLGQTQAQVLSQDELEREKGTSALYYQIIDELVPLKNLTIREVYLDDDIVIDDESLGTQVEASMEDKELIPLVIDLDYSQNPVKVLKIDSLSNVWQVNKVGDMQETGYALDEWVFEDTGASGAHEEEEEEVYTNLSITGSKSELTVVESFDDINITSNLNNIMNLVDVFNVRSSILSNST